MTTASAALSTTVLDKNIDLIKLYLASAVLPGRSGVYFIGPFGRRVSFASQQRRALNVVWALSKRNKLANNPSVAVIGGGIAGLTMCAALIAQKCSVTLIEAKDSVLNLQTNTSHRYVHPTVNFWPEKKVQPTTELPYLDWFEDRCMDVAGTIRTEWKKYFEPSLAHLKTRTQVTALECEGSSVKVTMNQSAGRPDEKSVSRTYDLVFVTSGFGRERLLDTGEKSYWENDGLDDERDAGTQDFVIAGTGDGGLIEALRLVQKKFQNGTFCLSMIKEFDIHGITGKIEKIETEVAAGFSDEAEAAIEYKRRYSDLLDDLPSRIMDQLRSRYSGIRVRLVGRLPAPYGLYVAPIHKIMIAAALKERAVEYIRGDLEFNAGKYTIKTTADELELDDGTKVVVRVGPIHPLANFLSEAEVEQLRVNQRATSDLLSPVEIDFASFPGFDQYPARKTNEVKFANFRKKMVDDYFMKYFRNKSRLEVVNGPHYILAVDPADPQNDLEVPESLFGIRVTSAEVMTGSEL